MEPKGMFFNASQIILKFFSIKLGENFEHTPTNNKKNLQTLQQFLRFRIPPKRLRIPGGDSKEFSSHNVYLIGLIN